MENYLNNQLSYSELVALVAKLSEESKIQPDYAENDPTKKSHILNRLCYETGEPAKIYTTESYSVNTESFLVSAGLCTNEIINEADLKKYSILVELRSGKKGAVPTTVEYNLSKMKATKTYYNGTLVGCKYTMNVGRVAYADARIYVINNYVLFNKMVIKDDKYQTPEFSGNGIYLCESVTDTFDSSVDGGVSDMYSNYVTVKNLRRISTIKIHRLPNRFISLLTHKDFKALKETVEGISFDTLPDRPFGDDYTFTESIKGALQNSNHIVDFNGEGGNWTAYQVTESTYTKDQILGGIVTDVWGKYTIDESHIIDESDDGLTVKIDGIYNTNYIWVAYTKNYQPEGFDEPLPEIGMYWSSWEAESGQESNRPQQLDLEYIGIKKLDNKFLDLPNNEDFKTLKKRVEEGGLGDPVRTTGTGVAYEAEVPGITELKQGISFLMKPHVENTTTNTTLNVNGLGAKPITRPCSDDSTYIAMPIGFFATGKAYRVVYDGIYWVLADFTIPAVSDSIGRLPVRQGGVPEADESNAGKVLTTDDKGIPQWQTPSNAGATVDKIRSVSFASGNDYGISVGDDGIEWINDEGEYELAREDGTTDYYYSGDTKFRVPIVAGENVTFEVDEDNRVVKVNAEGGSSDITIIDTFYGDTEEVELSEEGLSWGQYFAMLNDDGERVNEGSIAQRVPLVAGKNVTFDVDEESHVVKVNATGGTSDIVVPAKGSRGQANFVESIPGLLKLYNESCGLGIDNYGQVGVVAATNQDINAGTSMRKPIVPATFAYALSIFGLHFRVAIVEKNDTFAIKPGMIALVHPWDKASFYTPDGTAILTNAGMSFIFSSEPVDSSNNYNANGDKYWMSVASISGFSSTSKHNWYSTSSGYCYFKNAHSDSSGSGLAYIYYIG